MQNINVDYWIGPYDVRVANNIASVVAADGFNTLYKNGCETEMACTDVPEMSQEIYKAQLAELKTDGFYYYKTNDVAQNILNLKIAVNVDLINDENNFVRMIEGTTQMTESNYKELSPFPTTSFIQAVTKFDCDICSTLCSAKNPIYANDQYQGCDICTNCINNALKTIQPEPGLDPGPVYSLKKNIEHNGK